jgi:alkylated DNA repair protein alkB family protein 5
MSLLSEAPIVFGTRLDVVGEGEFAGTFSLPLPCGSVCVLKGNAADVAKHAIPSVPAKRVSITFRRIGDAKRPLARTVPFGGHEQRVLE